MSTTFSFPASPTLNQIVLLPDGGSAQWNGYAWVGVEEQVIVTYPLSIAQGGTSAATAAAARAALAILGTAGVEPMTAALKLFDGTVAAPGLAFASEPGLGVYRLGAGYLGWADGGGLGILFNMNAAALSGLNLYPRSAGSASVSLFNQPQGLADFNYLLLAQNTDGTAGLSLGIAGTATKKNMNFFGAASYYLDALVNLGAGKLQFPATQQASTDPNTLDDYREGTWTPTNAAVQPTINNSNFTKVGRLVYVNVQMTFPASASGSSVQFAGLPYAAVAGGPLSIGYVSAAPPGGLPFSVMVSGGLVNVYAGGGFATFAQLSNATLYFGGCYSAA